MVLDGVYLPCRDGIPPRLHVTAGELHSAPVQDTHELPKADYSVAVAVHRHDVSDAETNFTVAEMRKEAPDEGGNVEWVKASFFGNRIRRRLAAEVTEKRLCTLLRATEGKISGQVKEGRGETTAHREEGGREEGRASQLIPATRHFISCAVPSTAFAARNRILLPHRRRCSRSGQLRDKQPMPYLIS